MELHVPLVDTFAQSFPAGERSFRWVDGAFRSDDEVFADFALGRDERARPERPAQGRDRLRTAQGSDPAARLARAGLQHVCVIEPQPWPAAGLCLVQPTHSQLRPAHGRIA